MGARFREARDPVVMRVLRTGALVVLGSVIGLPAGIVAQQEPPVAQRALAGARVFGTKGCAGCHAVDGVGGGVGPDLARVAEAPSFFGLGASMWNHLPAMAARMRDRATPPATMAPWEAGDLVAFLFAIRYYSPPGDRRLGSDVFTNKGCVRCHQVRGAGGVVGPALDGMAGRGPPIELAAALWNHAPTMEREMRARGISRPALTAADLADLRAFLADSGIAGVDRPVHLLPGREDVGRALFRTKRCAVCHGPEGRGGQFGPDLSAVPRRDLTEFAAGMWNKAPAMLAAARRARIELPRLEAGEMADVVGFLGSLQYIAGEGSAQRGESRLEPLGCRRCHAAGGPGRAPDLARVAGVRTRAGVLAALWNHVALPDSLLGGRWDRLDGAAVADLTAYFAERGRGR